MDSVTLYFDRCVGTRLPEALRLLGLKNVVHHHSFGSQLGLGAAQGHTALFDDEEPDDSWLKFVGDRGWIVFTQDRKFHRSGHENELSAIKQYRAGRFYLWGAEATTWEKMRAFCRAFDNIVHAATDTARPFIFDVARSGRLTPIPIP